MATNPVPTNPSPGSPPPLLTLTIPWAPSANRIWRKYRGRVVLNPKVQGYRDAVVAAALEKFGAFPRPLEGRLSIELDLYPPKSKASFDVDNRVKPVLDAIQHARLVKDDAQFRRVVVTERDRDTSQPKGYIVITIAAWEG